MRSRSSGIFLNLVFSLLISNCAFAAGTGKAAGEGAMSGDLEQTAVSDRFMPTHSYAWNESRGTGKRTLIYLFDRDAPADSWADAEDRQRSIMAWILENKAAVVIWTLEGDGTADSVQSCGSDGTCRSTGNNVMNGVEGLVATIKSDLNGTLKGTLEQGDGACGDKWCNVVSRYTVDTRLAEPTLRDRLASAGKTDSADNAATKAALTAYWKAAGSAKKSEDLAPYFSAERSTENQRQNARNAEQQESMFKQMFVPAHSGKLEIVEIRQLDNFALAKVKSKVGSGNEAYEMECGVLLSKEGSNWKIGAEDC